ncbi:MAG: hypothetical protein MJ224_02655 [archaeon]|nr:hypothetical protein [archaeon]
MLYTKNLVRKKADKSFYVFANLKKELFQREVTAKAYNIHEEKDSFRIEGLLECTLSANEDSKYLCMIPKNTLYYEGIDDKGNDAVATACLLFCFKC